MCYKTKDRWKQLSAKQLTRRLIKLRAEFDFYKRDEEARNYFREANAVMGFLIAKK